jgi:predicted  nucleic acid-binding Zn-ribbon protein
LDAKSQLQRLLRVQELALEVRAARAVVAGASERIEAIEGRFRERNAEYVTMRDRRDALESDQRDREGESATLGETLKKYMDSLMQVKNQREYAAMLKEIDTVKVQIASHDEAILSDMEELDKLRVELDSRAAHIGEERERVDAERAQVDADAAAAQGQISRCEEERARIEAELPVDLVDNVRRVEEARAGIFLTKADKELCTACFVRVRPQVYQEIRQTLRIHTCGNCRRYLYYEPALRAPAERERREVGPTGMEATNGGAI